MTVDELRIILEHLPGDLPVHIRSRRCSHIGRVIRWRAAKVLAWPPGRQDRPAAVVLDGDTAPLWFEPAPAFTLVGPFRRAAELDARLDALDPLGGP